jgi:asparagine synthase (glutamine-hydrolysing)
MCGIAGIITNNINNLSLEKLKLMTNSIAHRGPDGEGQWVDESGKVGLAHRRLSILDLNSSSDQPMHYLDRYSIVFNGEIYNYIELKEVLISKGYKFYTKSDTEVLLALYDFKKCDFLDDLDGMFAFAIWDKQTKTLFCARDRFGEKPFFYYQDQDSFYFASEMKALFSIGINKTINRKRAFEYLLYTTIENPYDRSETFYSEIKQLPPSSSLIYNIENKNFVINKYWDLSINSTFNGSFIDASEKFKELFSESIKFRLRSDVKTGSSLSGGLDSSAIVCLANILLPTNTEQHVFSARFPGFIKDEGGFIDIAIRSCNNAKVVKHEVFPNDDSMLNNIEKIIYHQEEPFGSASIAAQFEVMQLASKNGVKVLLDGQGADEVLAGYTPFYETYLRQLYKRNKKEYVIAYERIKNNSTVEIDKINYKDFGKLYAYKVSKKFGQIRRNIINNDSPYFLNINPELVNDFKNSKNPIFTPPNLKQHLKFMLLNRGLNELLRYADRNSMANSVEVRLPFLSHRLVEFVFSLPDNFFINDGWTKFLLRYSMNGIIPNEIQWRKDKIGYEPPQSNWMTNKFIIDLVKSSQSKLIDNKILKNINHELNWHHLMLGMLYEK